jgi:hypothetical protein
MNVQVWCVVIETMDIEVPLIISVVFLLVLSIEKNPIFELTFNKWNVL